jgi:hypothetical protein
MPRVWEDGTSPLEVSAVLASSRSLRQAQGRLFDFASRDETARAFAQDDSLYLRQSLTVNLCADIVCVEFMLMYGAIYGY